MPSPAGGILVLSPLIYELSGFDFMNINYKLITPIIFVIISILLISKIPTYSFKKIVVPRSTTIFLLFGIVLLFGLLLVFPFKFPKVSPVKKIYPSENMLEEGVSSSGLPNNFVHNSLPLESNFIRKISRFPLFI